MVIEVTVARDGRTLFGRKRWKVTFRRRQGGGGHLTRFGLSSREVTKAVREMLEQLLIHGGAWELRVEDGAVPPTLRKMPSI